MGVEIITPRVGTLLMHSGPTLYSQLSLRPTALEGAASREHAGCYETNDEAKIRINSRLTEILDTEN